MKLNKTIDNNILTIHFDGEINSTNSQSVHDEIVSLLEKDINNLVFDFSNLSYISSAGLRILLVIKKQYDSLKIVGCNLEVYDILEMTGFTKIINVSKALKEISVDGCKVIGEGRAGIVYRINKDTIVKVYKRADSLESIQRELDLSKQAFVLGIPTAISFDIVKVGSRFAARYEMLDFLTLRDFLANNPDKYLEYAEKWANLVKKINTTESTTNDLINKKDKWLKELNIIKDSLDEGMFNKLKEMVEDIKDTNTFIHGDCHPKNIMFNGDEVYLIDMGSLAVGNPIFELAPLYRTFILFDILDPGNTGRFFELDHDLAMKFFKAFMNNYFDNYNEEIENKIRLTALIYFCGWLHRYNSDNKENFERIIKEIKELTPKVNNLNIW